MGKVIDFNQSRTEDLDIDSMDKDALLSYLEQLRARIGELDDAEPKNMNSEAYQAWGELHEELEDLVDDVLDRLDEMKS